MDTDAGEFSSVQTYVQKFEVCVSGDLGNESGQKILGFCHNWCVYNFCYFCGGKAKIPQFTRGNLRSGVLVFGWARATTLSRSLEKKERLITGYTRGYPEPSCAGSTVKNRK